MKNLLSLHRYILGIACLLISFQVQAQSPSLRSIVERTTISSDETLILTVRYNGPRQQSQPSFAQLNSHFTIKSRQQSNQHSIINGKVSSHTDWTLTLYPKKEGRLIIPSFRLGSVISDAVEITVTPERQLPAGQVKDIFIETVIDKTSLYVQEQLTLTYRLFYSRNVNAFEAEPLVLENVIKDSLPNARYNRRINGKLYAIAEYSYALFPQVSGEFEIPSLQWLIKIPRKNSNRSFFGLSGQTEVVRRRTDKHTITVLPRSSTYPRNKPWLPATHVSLDESWSQDPNQMTTGEPLTRTIVLKVKGLMASQLPPVWQQQVVNNLKIYADKPELSDEKNSDGFTAIRIESAAVVLNAEGSVTLPAVKVPWWNTNTDTLEWAAIPERVITAKGSTPLYAPLNSTLNSPQNAGSIASSTPLATGQANPTIISSEEKDELTSQLFFWKTLSQVLLVLLGASISYIIYVLRRPAAKPSSRYNSDESNIKKAFSLLQKHCQSGHSKELREALLIWANLYWKLHAPKTLQDIADRIDDENIRDEIKILDANLYADAPDSPREGSKLAQLLKTYVSQQKDQSANKELQPLYGR